ncbi:MAG TPA: cysteine--tRNA ligase [Micropepsaceae bacterium]
MNLRLYNTLTRTKEDFVPLDAKNVRMYVCGPTVYDFAHIGNARPVIVFDVLFRLLRHLYGAEHVTYVRNITDVDDKINARASEIAGERGLSVEAARSELTARTVQQFQDDVAALGCLPPTHQPRATEHIAAMIAMNERLIAAGHAYAAEGHVLYDVSSKPDYGKLARRSLDEMMAGARVEVAPYKKSPMDFVLWKPSTPEQPGWDSPWGRGRPGWHIECSAMSESLLGETFDIHGGGIDLVFPHHENEIAQSEGAHHGHALAKVWMHNGFLQVEGEKMSKSLGNFVTIRELMRGWASTAWSGSVIRLAMLRSHYRQPINWTSESLAEAKRELATWVGVIRGFISRAQIKEREVGNVPTPDFVSALLDDLNLPEALTALRTQHSAAARGDLESATSLYKNLRFLGLIDMQKAAAYIQGVSSAGPLTHEKLFENYDLGDSLKTAYLNNDTEFQNQIGVELQKRNIKAFIDRLGVTLQLIDETVKVDPKPDYIQELIAARNEARKAKNFKESDRIRDELLAKGIVLKDGPTGTTWEVKR